MDTMDKAKDSFLELLATLEGDELLSFETFVGVAIGKLSNPTHTHALSMILSSKQENSSHTACFFP